MDLVKFLATVILGMGSGFLITFNFSSVYTYHVPLTLGRTSKLIPPPWYRARGVGGGGRRVDGTPLWVFVMLQYFEKFSPLVESLRCTLQDEVYIMGCGAAGGPITSSNVAAILYFTKIENLTGKREN